MELMILFILMKRVNIVVIIQKELIGYLSKNKILGKNIYPNILNDFNIDIEEYFKI